MMKVCCLSLMGKNYVAVFHTNFSQHRYQHTNANNSWMFSLAPILQMSDVQIELTLLIFIQKYWTITWFRLLYIIKFPTIYYLHII